MNLKIAPLATKFALSLVTAAALWGATAIVDGVRADAVQDERITHLEKTMEKVEKLSDKLDATQESVARLQARLDYEDKHVPRN